MDYELKFSSQTQRFINKINNNISKRILEKFKIIKKNPFRYLEHYEGPYNYKLRIGDYRALIDIDFNRKIFICKSF